MCEEITKVMFRKWVRKEDQQPFGDNVIALFPEIKEHRPGMVLSYMHHDQHGAAGIEYVMQVTRPATTDEYAALKKELERPPFEYKLKVIVRRPH